MANENESQLNILDQAPEISLMETLIRLTLQKRVHSTIYLINGIKLDGLVLDVDQTSLLYSKAGSSDVPMAVNLAAIASFVPKSDVTDGAGARR